ncbi:MAG: UDP-N-acetylmuramoyl-tripeptide--D-alanyl-D-alanine ligase [Holosporaceae bacterium]|jgi:UDP-N-acetylmuramoyl-tripeptide--D-alanyl-D-alanine ligase|nr:UDP-N-acetylmuramoyl-tripeptide--D-alanyl-D-alanine ligase [Holosporaceae bacterium]
MIFSANELSEIFDQTITENIDDVCVNSNDAKTGDLFIALEGEKIDGHKFIGAAMDNGAVLAISEKNISNVDAKRIIKVKSSYEALLKLARYNIAKSPDAKYVGITGSVGKTTTKNLIFHILFSQPEIKNQVYASKKNFNSQIGLPICAATAPRNAKFGIFEMGMSGQGDIKKLINIVPPSVSVISQVCEAHLEFFNSIWDIAKAKSEIFETIKPQEAVVIPQDSPYADFLKRRAAENGIKNVFTFGLKNADAQILVQNNVGDYWEIIAEILGEKIKYSAVNSNYSLIFNSLSSILCAHLISGISLQKLANAVGLFSSSPGRGASIYVKNRNIILVDDSYNACPTSLKSAIQSLPNDRRKILALGDMLELGKDAIHYHRNLSATIDKFGIDAVFACGPLAKQLFDNLRDCKKGAWAENSLELSKKVLESIQDGDCVLVKGSNSMKMNLIVEQVQKSDR